MSIIPAPLLLRLQKPSAIRLNSLNPTFHPKLFLRRASVAHRLTKWFFSPAPLLQAVLHLTATSMAANVHLDKHRSPAVSGGRSVIPPFLSPPGAAFPSHKKVRYVQTRPARVLIKLTFL